MQVRILSGFPSSSIPTVEEADLKSVKCQFESDLEHMDIKQFKALIETYEEAGLNLGEAYFLLKYNQAEQHHKEMLKKLDGIEDWVRAIREGRGPFYS